jgi:CheY-like chemotaxis protein
MADILIVDDNKDVLKVLKEMLEAGGHAVETANSGEDALALARDLPQLIILDVKMPGMSGYEVMDRLKAGKETKGIPILILTAWDHIGSKEEALEKGASGYIGKPIQLKDLLAKVEEVLSF